MLGKLMTDKLMARYNYAGRGQKGKKSFKILPALPDVMLGELFHSSPACLRCNESLLNGSLYETVDKMRIADTFYQ
jgi:hypothetical protein